MAETENTFGAVLRAAGMSPALAELLVPCQCEVVKHVILNALQYNIILFSPGEGINEDQFQIMDTTFMREILSLNAGQIFDVLSIRRNMSLPSETARAVSFSPHMTVDEDLDFSDSDPGELSEYVDEKEYSPYELVNMRSQLRRYHAAVKIGAPFAELVKPAFLKSSKKSVKSVSMVALNESQVRAGCSSQKSKRNPEANNVSCAENSSENELESFGDENSMKVTHNKPQVRAGCSSQKSKRNTEADNVSCGENSSENELESFVDEHSIKVGGRSTKRRRSPNPAFASDEEGVSMGEDDDEITSADIEAAIENFKRDPDPEFALLKGTLPSFDVLNILKVEMREAKGPVKSCFLDLLRDKFLERKKRLCIMRALTRHLYTKHVSNPSLVTSQMKEGLAKSFCIVFPEFANLEDKSQPWSPLYNYKGPSGYIMNSSRAFMREFNQKPKSKKKRKTRPNNETYDEDDVAALGLVNPGRAEKNEVLDGMAKCFYMREDERLKGNTITFFFEKLNEEFKRMKPEAEDGCKIFLKYQSKILGLKLKRETSLPVQDDTLKALLILTQHLPHDIPAKKDRKKGYSRIWAELKDILVVLKLSDDVEKYVEDKVNKSKTAIQPYLILVKGQANANRIIKSFLVLDGKIMEIQSLSTLKSIDWLFKSFYVFNVCFPLGWRNAFHCLQTCFYKFFETLGRKKDAVTCSEFNLMKTLNTQAQTAPS